MKHTYKKDIIALRKQGLTYDEITTKLGCAKSTVSHHCKKSNLGYKPLNIDWEEVSEYYKTHTCKITSEKYNVSTTTIKKYCGKKSIKSNLDGIKMTTAMSNRKYRSKYKEKSLAYKGTSCVNCGYNKNHKALQFHHLDPTQKEFNISKAHRNKSWEKTKEELDKCIVLCANCHIEEHDRLLNLKYNII